MKPISLLATLALISSFNAFAQYHNDITPIRTARNDAKEVIRNFELQFRAVDAGAPEYLKIYQEDFLPKLKDETRKLEDSLDFINQSLSKDYSLIVSLKGKPQTTALKQTIKQAENRLESQANDLLDDYYHKPIKSVVTLDNSFSEVAKKCLTVLCVNQIKQDFIKWIKLSSSLNKSLDLETTSMEKIPKFNSFTKSSLDSIESEASVIGLYLPISITQEEYQEILRTQEAARIQAELDAKKDKFGCQNVEFLAGDIHNCEFPYVVKNGERINLAANSLSEDKYKNICASIKMKSTLEVVPWELSSWENQFDSTFVKGVVCVEPPKKTHEERLSSESKARLEDGTTHIYYPGYHYKNGWAAIAAQAPKETCQFFGFSGAVNTENWQTGLNQYVQRNLIVVSKTQVKVVNQGRIWRKIICN